MSWGEALENINFLAVLLGTGGTMVLGALWYASKVFGRDWMRLVGLKEKDLKNSQDMTAVMGSSTLFYFIASIALAALMQLSGLTGPLDGASMGAIVGFAFGFGPLVVTYGFARRKFELGLIDGGFIIAALGLSGWIIGLMN